MFLRIVAEGKVEIYRNPIMEGEARCVGFGSYWLGPRTAVPPLRPDKYCRNGQLKDGDDCRKVAYGSAGRGTMLQH